MRYIDLHCDTASRMLYEDQGLKKNSFSIDIEKLKKGGALAQVFAFFIDVGETDDPFIEFQVMKQNFMNELEKNKKEITLVRNVNELNLAVKKGKIGAFLSIEEGEVLQGKMENIKGVYEAGIRIITLTWNYKNTIGYPNYNYIYKDNGLTDLGIEMVGEMERVGILPDASHLSDQGFMDLIKYCKKPFIVTHSNSRAVKSHPRNLDDDMIKLLAEKGGVMGLNFCADFVGNNKVTSIDDMVRHLKHIKNVGGTEVMAIGGDFDGIRDKVEINDASEMGKLALALEKAGFKEDDIEKIFYKNTLRLFMDVLK